MTHKLSMLSTVPGGIRSKLAMMISKGESSPDDRTVNYNIHNVMSISLNARGERVVRYLSRTANLSNLTLAELAMVHGNGEDKYRAVGRWQILPEPMKEFKRWLGVSDNERFSNHFQDLYVVYALLKKRSPVAAFLLSKPIKYGTLYKNSAALKRKSPIAFKGGYGVPSAEYAAMLLSMEWSSKSTLDNVTFYGNGVDKAHVTFDEAVRALIDAKQLVVEAQQKGGFSDAQLVWRALGGSLGNFGAVEIDIRSNGDFTKYSNSNKVTLDKASTSRLLNNPASLDNRTATVISDAHATGNVHVDAGSRSGKHRSLIRRGNAVPIKRDARNGVTIVTYSDGSILTEGPIVAKGRYKLSRKSIANLNGVHPDLVRVIKRAIVLTGQDFSVAEGLRTESRQRELMSQGKAKTLDSKHIKQQDGYGHAVDLYAYPLRWDSLPYFSIANAVSVAARELGVAIRWGGSWTNIAVAGFSASQANAAYVNSKLAKKEKPFVNLVHFELLEE